MSKLTMPLSPRDDVVPEYCTMRNLSAGALLALSWQRSMPPGTAPPPTADILPQDANASTCRRVQRKKAVAAQNEESTRVEGENEVGTPRRGVRSLSAVRVLTANPKLLRDSAPESAQAGKKPCVDMWKWQHSEFDLRHELVKDARSKTQVRADRQRDANRARLRDFHAHLKTVAQRQSANRVPLRKFPQTVGPAAAHVEAADVATFAAVPRPPPMPPLVVPTRPLTGRPSRPAKPPAATAASDSHRPMSSRVRSRIAELANTFLPPAA